MAKKPIIGIGIHSFSELIGEGCYYIDKTDLIRELLESRKKVTLFTRPRRFGKTLALSMLAEFFDITKKEKNAHLFDGLKISEYPKICREYQNAYPVVSLSFKEVQGNNPDKVLLILRDLIAGLYQNYADILLPELKIEAQKNRFLSIESGKCNDSELAGSLKFLTQLLYRHYGVPVIVLLDEYDVPLQKAFINDFYKSILDPIRGMMSAVFKDNDFLKFGVITGCLRIVKKSIFTGMNNLTINSVLTEGRSEYFGFTPAETEKLLIDCGIANKIRTVRQWYDGYKFGKNEVYNPWSVLNFADQGMLDPKIAAQPYWMNTSGNDIFNYLIKYYDQNQITRSEIKALIAGGSVTKKIDEGTTFRDLDNDPESIWSILLFTGYLKPKSAPKMCDGKKVCALTLPNKEVREILLGMFTDWFSNKTASSRLPNLAEKFLTGDADAAAAEVTDYMQDAVSLRDSHEAYYQGMLTTLMRPVKDQCYTVSNEPESGKGYPDIVVKEAKRSVYAVIEIKRAAAPKGSSAVSPQKWEERLDQSFEAALDKAEYQIRNRTYISKELKGYRTQFAYAAAFYNKECRIRKVEL